MPFFAQHVKIGRLHLQKNDPVIKRLLKSVGPFTARTKRDRFGTLVNSIISQQISVAAARTIRQRLIDAVAPKKLAPETLTPFTVDDLREVGVSRQKATYILDIAEKVGSGAVALDTLHRLDDEAVIAELTKIKGVGRWTAQMFLIFSLGRLDVLPVDDLGLKTAIQNEYKLSSLPQKEDIERIAKNWHPYATIASWYLWRSLETD